MYRLFRESDAQPYILKALQLGIYYTPDLLKDPKNGLYMDHGKQNGNYYTNNGVHIGVI